MFHSLLAKFAACPEISLSSLILSEFRQTIHFLDPLAPLPSSANTIKKVLVDESQNVQDKLKDVLQKHRHSMSATADIWTDPSMLHSYLGTTVHFVDGDHLTMCFIGLIELEERHTAENVKKAFELQLEKYGLKTTDFFAIVTDNGSNIIKAFQIEDGKLIFNCLIYYFCKDDDDDITNSLLNEDQNEYDISTGDNDDYDLMNLMNENQLETIEPIGRYSCAAHNLQLVLFNAIKGSLATSTAFKKLLKFQGSFGHSQQARSKLKEHGKLYKTFVPTRWASWVDVVERYLEVKDQMKQVTNHLLFLKCINRLHLKEN